jgi:hypothetical protein
MNSPSRTRKSAVSVGAILLLILALAGLVRLFDLSTYGPTPGDDASYLNSVRDGYSSWRLSHPSSSFAFRAFSPFMVANDLARRSYRDMAFTSLAKPLYMLKLSAIEGAVGLTLYRQQWSLAISGLAVVLVVFSIGRRLFGSAAGLIAASLAAVSPWLTRYSTYGIPTMDSLLFLLLAFRGLVALRFIPLLVGICLGAAVLANPTVIWPAVAVLGLAAIRRWLEGAQAQACGYQGDARSAARPPGRKALRGCLTLLFGFLLLPLLWEALGLIQSRILAVPYRPFWAGFAQTAEDNAFHASLLPIDHLFWLRLIHATEGRPQLILWIVSLIWTVRAVFRTDRSDRFPLLALLAASLASISAATWSGSTQCARHYVFAWSLALAPIGGLAASWLKGRVLFSGSRRFVRGAILALLLLAALLFSGKSLLVYRYSRQGAFRLAAWMSENAPAGRVLAPANQPAALWPEVPRFHSWSELAQREKAQGPLYLVYGDYLAITRGIWDYPLEMFQIAQSCRAIEGEAFRAGTHLSDPSFLYENEDYYWGFVRQRKEVFDPDLRVIPVAAVLAFRAHPPRPADAVTVKWVHEDGARGTNIYWSFVRFAVFPFRGAWPPFLALLALGLLVLFLSAPAPSELVRGLQAARLVIVLALVLAVAAVFRFHGLKRFSQMGGDDAEYRTYVEKGRTFPLFQGRGIASPFILAVHLTQLDVNKTVTSMAKPFFLLERCLLDYLLGSSARTIQFWTCCKGLITVLLIYGLGRRAAGRAAGLVAAFLWAISPWAVTYSTWGIHATGGGLWFALALWAYLAARSSGRPRRFLAAGLLVGASLFFSSSDLWPGFCLLAVDGVWRILRLFRGPRRREIVVGGIALLGGAAAVWLGWEVLSFLSTRTVGSSYVPYHRILAATFRDNLLHARALPVDFWFFWRYLFVSEGPLATAAAISSLIWAAGAVRRRRLPEGLGFLLALFFGAAVAVTYTGAAQVIRHYFPAWIPLVVIMAAAARDLVRRWRPFRWAIGALMLILLLSHWGRLETFRLARWAPDRVKAWAWIHFIPHGVATLICQDLSPWPDLRPAASWDDLSASAAQEPPGAMMYSDYIELAHGSWFYTRKEYYEISEVARRSSGDLFRTPSYLSYLPSLFENEFYYWGLLRESSVSFDPAIRIFPAASLLGQWDRIRSDPRGLEDLWAPTKAPAPVRLPARPDDILRPFLAPRSRPSYAPHLMATLLIFLLLSIVSQPREGTG